MSWGLNFSRRCSLTKMASLRMVILKGASLPLSMGVCTRAPGPRRQVIAGMVRCMSIDLPQKKSIIFLGTPSVAAAVLDALLDAAEGSSLFEVTGVVTQPASTRGRGRKKEPSPVEQRALERNFPASHIFSPLKAGEESFLTGLQELKPDLCVTAAYGNILPNKFLSLPTCGTVNVHPSLLPLYRGAAPVQRAIQDGVKVSGVTVAYTVRALDAGPIIASKSMEVDPDVKAPELLKILFQQGSTLLLGELPAILDGTARSKAVEQDHSKATLAPKVTVDESWLNFDDSAEVLHNKVRAFAEWPGTRATFQLCSPDGEVQTVELKVVTTRIGSSASTGGLEVSLVNGSLVVPCAKDSTLEILQLQPPAKKVMSGRDFFNGLRGRKLMIDARSCFKLASS
ncbi:unnamed protein product [Calypogeia fissa]